MTKKEEKGSIAMYNEGLDSINNLSSNEDKELSTALEELHEEEKIANNPRSKATWKYGLFLDEKNCIRKGIYDEKNDKKSSLIICQGYVYIDREIKSLSDNKNRFVLKVKPLHRDEIELEIDACDMADNRKLQGILCNYFGSDDIGELKIKYIKHFSDHPLRTINLFKKPQWYNNAIVTPGIGNPDNRFDYEKNVVVDFKTDGNWKLGIEALENIKKGFDSKHAVIGIATFMGAPVIGKLWEGDRFYLFLQATTGFMKTAYVNLIAPLYGQGYSQEGNLLRWGQGTTINAAAHVAAMSGPFPFILDNYKAYGKNDATDIIKLIHSILEGSERAGMEHNKQKLRESEPYLCIPIITGENHPGSDAATRARGILLKWEGPKDLDAITEAQNHIADINALGKQWIMWLNSEDGQEMMEFIADNFTSKREFYIKKVKDSVNAGRIATNAAILSLIWDLMIFCPYTRDFADKYNEVMQQAIDAHILEASEDVSSNTEAEKFMSWFRSALETNQFFISGLGKSELSIDKSAEAHKAAMKSHIGMCKDNEIWITPDVLDNVLLPAWLKVNEGIHVDKQSLRRQLYERNYILRNEKDQKYTSPEWVDGKTRKVIKFKKDKLYS